MAAGAPPSSPDPCSARAVAPSTRSMSAGAPPSSRDPGSSSGVVAPSAHVAVAVAIAMPRPAPAPPAAAAEDQQVRPLPPTDIELSFPCAVACVLGGSNRARRGVPLVVIHILIVVMRVFTFTTDPEEARFWLPFFRFLLYLLLTVWALMMCSWVYYYMPVYGVYARHPEKFDQLQRRPGTAVVAVAPAEQFLLPPPPPEMDMC